MTYSSSYHNGVVRQRTCFNGDCHTLYGFGTIRYINNAIVVQCAGQQPTIYDPKAMRGYNCNTNTPIYR